MSAPAAARVGVAGERDLQPPFATQKMAASVLVHPWAATQQPFVARVWREGKHVYLGRFATSEEAGEAALQARHTAADAAPLTAAEAWFQAAVDGLSLLQSESNISGFKHVQKQRGRPGPRHRR